MTAVSPTLAVAPTGSGPRVHTLVAARIVRLVLPLVLMSGVIVATLPIQYRYLAAPVCTAIVVAALFYAILWNRDRRLPIFEVGSLAVAATLVYAVLPFIAFMLGSLQWGEWTDGRLVRYEFNSPELGAFAWRYVVYLSSLVVAYLLIRGRAAVRDNRFERIRPELIISLLVVLALAYAFKWSIYLIYGLDFDAPYNDLMQLTSLMRAIPYSVLQVYHNVFSAILLLKQALVLVLLRYWHSWRWRVVLIGWLAFEIISLAIRLRARSYAVFMLLTALILYHRMVRPLRARTVILGGAALLCGFILIGYVRGMGGYHRSVTFRGLVTASNEFQSLFSTAFDIYQRKKLGTLGPVPWQVYISDLYLLVPSQLLPFEKIDPSVWYLEVMGARDTGVGFMFGVMSQAVLGFDWIELVLRGAVLGILLAALHRWYVRHATSFWATLLYLFVAIWTYYTLRATTFWFVYFIVYQFIPVILAVKLTELALSHHRPWKTQRRGIPLNAT